MRGPYDDCGLPYQTGNGPDDGRENEEPTEMISGKHMTKEEFVDWLNEIVQPTFGMFVVEEHFEGRLHLSFPFKEDE